jgi:hypothetical protein
MEASPGGTRQERVEKMRFHFSCTTERLVIYSRREQITGRTHAMFDHDSEAEKSTEPHTGKN